MTSFGEVGAAYIRIRPDLSSFRREAQSGIKSAFAGLGEQRVAGLDRAERQFHSLGLAAKESAAQQTSAIRQVRTARESAARSNVAAALRERRALQEELVEYRRIAAAAVAGSRTQIEANNLAATSAERLGIQLTQVERHARLANGQMNKLERGAIAGSGALGGMGRNVAFASLSFIGAYGLIHSIRSALEEAGELNNETARSETIFRGSAGAIRKWSQEASPALGFAKSEALGAANSFGTMLSAMEVGSKQAVAFSEDITRVAAAISLARGESDPDRATAALRVALAGRGRALRQYGIILDETSIKAKAAQLGLVPSTVDPEKLTLAQRHLAEATVALQEARAKGTPLQIAKAEDAVTVAQRNLKLEIAGTTGEVTRQAKAVAAHAIIMEQGQHFLDRYGVSLQTAAGRSRRFHEGVDELKEELGSELYPAFGKSVDGINAWIRSVREGGPRHEEFKKDLEDVRQAADHLYSGLKLVGNATTGLAHLAGGFGNLVEILGLVYAANKALKLAAAIRESRLALFLLGRQAPLTAATVVASENAMAAGAGRLAATLAIAGRLAKLGAAAGYIAILAELANDKPKSGGGFLGLNVDGPLQALEVLGTFGQKGFRGPPKDRAAAKRRAAQLRLENYGEETIYRVLRDEGFSRKLTAEAIVTTREHPGGKIRGASPEDVRSLFASPTLLRGAGGQNLAVRQVKSELGALAKEIESGETITKARAKKLSTSLSQVIAEITDGAFAPSTRNRLISRARQLAVELADAGAGIGSATVAALRKDKADIGRELRDIGNEIATARADMQTAISDAIKGAAEAERSAVSEAKANLNSLGSSLADFINRFVDAQAEKATNAPLSGPLAERLKALYALIREGKATPQLIAEAKRVEHELNEQSSKTAEDTTKRKERITRGLADLTDQLNTGKIGVEKFNREVARLLRREGISYKAAGRVLGIAFADGFSVALKELKGQAVALVATPAKLRRQGTGFEQGIVKPAEVIREQTANIARVEKEQQGRLRELIARRHELLLKEQQDANKLARIQRSRTNALLSLLKPPRADGRPERKPDREPDRPRRRERVAGHGPDPLGEPQTKTTYSSRAKVHIDVKADDQKTRGELDRLRSFIRREHLTLGLSVRRVPGDQSRALASARAGGHGIGGALMAGIDRGIHDRAEAAAISMQKAIRRVLKAAKQLARIGSPSQLTYEEIGLPLMQGVELAVAGSGERLGAILSAELRRAITRADRQARASQRLAERPRAALRPAFERPPAPRPPLRRATERQAPGPGPVLRTARPAAPGRVIERIEDTRANNQRGLLLGEARIHTGLLRKISRQEGTQIELLQAVDRDLGGRSHKPSKNPRRATEAGHAAARHNLLG